MEKVLKLLVFAKLFACQVNCESYVHFNQTIVVPCVSGEMDQKFFAQVLSNKSNLHIWHSDARKLVVTSDNPMQTLTILEAPRLSKLELYSNTQLNQLTLRHCPLDGLVKSLYNLQALNVLNITVCRLNGTFNVAELLPLRNLTAFSLEANRLKDVMFQPDEFTKETEPTSALRKLDLTSNQIEHFNLNVLRAFPMLKELILARNELVKLEGSVSLPTLIMLDVKQNLLPELDLSGCNCSSLLSVYASSNKLSTFPMFGESITAIQVLDLNDNQLPTFNGIELNKQQNLTTLLMSGNALKTFNVDSGNDTAVELPSLKLLELLNNRIESLDLRGWQLPSLETLRVLNNPLVTIPDDLLERYPQLARIECDCPNVDCEWILRNVEHIRNRRFEMSVAWQGPMQVGKDYRCVTVPYVGCVRCPFRRKKIEMKKPVL